MDVLEYLESKKEMIDEEIDRILPRGIEPEELVGASRHLVEAGGKRMRPVLTLTSAKAVGGKEEEVLTSAAAIEILHTFTLVHDDIMDKDESRRGATSVHVAWDEPMAIIAGDALFAKVFQALSRNIKEGNFSADEATEVFDTVSRASLQICQGQALDMKFGKGEDVKESDYLEMVRLKTGVLIEAATRVGATLGGGTSEEIEALAEYGKLVGIAFQIHDDLLGVVGDQEKVGKPIGSDIKEGKKTYLAVHALQEADGEERKFLFDILSKRGGTDEEVEKVLRIYEETGAVESAKKKSRELVEKAKSELEILPDSEAKNFLLKIADFSVEREL